MVKITFIGNLTKDAQRRNRYILLQVAQNIYQRISKADGQTEYQQGDTIYYSVFFNAGHAAFIAQNLTKGQTVKITGIQRLKRFKNAQGYSQFMINTITGTGINTTPFQC